MISATTRGWCIRRPALAMLALAMLVLAILGPRAGRAETLQCLTLRGPCQNIDTIDVLLSPAPAVGAAPARAPALVANFGLLVHDGAGRLRYACESALGGLSARARISPSGEIFVPNDEGLLRYRPGCAAQAASGDIAGHVVFALAFDRGDAQRIWALSIDGPSSVYVSRDGGQRFVRQSVLPAELPIWQLKAAPSRPDTLYGLGERRPGGHLLLVRSDDGGASFVDVASRPGAEALAGLPLDLLGVDPENPEILYVGMRDGNNTDVLWRSRNGGLSWQRSLALPGNEYFGGFTFGPASGGDPGAGRTLFVGSQSQTAGPNVAPAQLYTSLDGGDSWQAPLPSGASGPRFRCLAWQGDLLYACAGGSSNGDQFLLGRSNDGGKHWTPVITTEEIAGPEPCMRDSCAATATWLCDSYQLCSGDDAGAPGGDARDADRADATGDEAADSAAAAAPASGGGCGCDLGAGGGPGRGAAPGGGLGALAVVAMSAMVAGRRRHGRQERSRSISRRAGRAA